MTKEQIATVGYTTSGYLPGSQTFQVYTTANGVNLSQTKQAITYIISALSSGIPVFAGVDAYAGSVNFDNTTDHFITIDGMGTDAKGKYFHFIDNSTSDSFAGDYNGNKLYYNETTGLITGQTASGYPGNVPGSHNYILAQVRKSIKQ